ncbi:hypothetical protein NQD34_009644 [Periophthalmus magnuspinnatus]|nr:hypothetical protein NQD34_009644 [Periophthalmus magnuspinnatus]
MCQHFNMVQDAIDMPLAAAQHNSFRLSMECSCARIVICVLVSLWGDWCEPKWDKCAKPRQCFVKGLSIQSVTLGHQNWERSILNIRLNAKCALQGCTARPNSNIQPDNSLGMSYTDLMEETCLCGYDVKSKLHRSDNGATVTSSDMRTSGARLNLHFFMAILLSTNKLTPEKT